METIEMKEVLNNISKLKESDLEKFLMQVGVILARKKASSLPKEESNLLKKINNSLPEITRIRYQTLRKKQQENKLTTNERTELLNLVEVVENADVKRLKAMIMLSQIKNTTLDTLTKELGFYNSNAGL